ncbi:MAG: alanine racemase [Thermoleophilia bacterium]|nr:alanine racemase [Thermoleophilia bacterium]
MPRLTIDLAKIKHNTSLIVELLKPHGVKLSGVTKACLGNELVGKAMLDGGAAGLADSRAENIRNLRRHFQGAELTLLRSSVTPEDACIEADVYYVSSYEQALPLLRMSPHKPQKFCLLLETGDGREGVPLELASDEASRIAGLPEAVLVGLATNAACARIDVPVGVSLQSFNEAAARIAWRLRRGRMGCAGGGSAKAQDNADDPVDLERMLPVMSVGGSGLLQLVTGPEEGGEQQPGWGMSLFAPVTELRCGEAILLGRIPSGQSPDLYLQGAHRDAFVLEGPVLEIFEKSGVNQALVGFGVQDTGGAGLIPCHPGITPAGMTSDYLAIDCTSPELRAHPLRVGEAVRFLPTYYALLAAMTSPYVEKNFI